MRTIFIINVARGFVVILALSFAGSAVAQDSAPTEARDDPNLLRGPTVPQAVVQSLVNVDATGNFVPLSVRPEEAAIEMAPLDPMHRDDAQAAIAARRTAIGMLLVENIDLVKEGTDAIMSGDRERAEAIYRDLHGRFDAEAGRDPLLRDFAEILSPAELDEVTRLVDEYWDAWLAWELRNAGDVAEDVRKQRERTLAFQLFQREIGEAYDWALRPFRQKLDALYAITEPNPDQRAAMREVIIDYIRASQLEPTAEQRREVTDRMYDLLDEEQRKRLFEHALWRAL